MLNGLDPIIIFSLYKNIQDVGTTFGKIPAISDYLNRISFPPIPIYLSESRTGIYIESEDKNIDIDTSVSTTFAGDAIDVAQKAVASTISINMKANRDSVGLTILSAFADVVFPKLTSQEYSITYLHGATTLFNGLIHAFSVSQNSENDLYNIKLDIVQGSVRKTQPQVSTDSKGAASLNSATHDISGKLPNGTTNFTAGQPPPVTQVRD